ncbi:MAG: hypothetical protein ACI4Q3_08720 [Kiritimatiellia bacterium]
MNPKKLMAVAFCAVACVSTTVFAEDDFGIESASPVTIADPVNPQPGMVCKFYNVARRDIEKCLKSATQRVAFPLVLTRVDKGNAFVCNFSDKGVERNVMSWEGFIKCKRAGSYVFTVFGAHDHDYTLTVNGVDAIVYKHGQQSVTLNLKVGWNKVVFTAVYWCRDRDVYIIKYLPKGSLSEPRNLAPKDLFYDKLPEEEW